MRKFFYLCLPLLLLSCTKVDKNNDQTDNMKDAVLENILTRKSVRQFTDEPVDKADVDAILRAAFAAPSAVNKQPWEMMVITERQLLDNIGSQLPNTRVSNNVQIAFVVCGDMNNRLPEPIQDFWVQDCSAMTENLLLAAHALGLGAVWCGIYPDPVKVEKLQIILSLPQHIVPLCVVPVGHKAEDPEPKDKWNENKIHYNVF